MTNLENIRIWLDARIPASIRENPKTTIETMTRCRVLVAMLLVCLFVVTLSLASFVLLQLSSQSDFLSFIMISGGAMLVILLEYLVFFKAAKPNISAVIFSSIFNTAVLLVVVITGGINSPVVIMLLICPIISFLIGGRYEGFYSAILILAASVSLILMDSLGIEFFNIIHASDKITFQYAAWFSTISFLVICLSVYDLMLEGMSRELSHHKH